MSNSLRDKIDILEMMFGRETQVSRSGVYLVKIYQENTWKSVIVDDWVPCLRLKAGKDSKKEKVSNAFVGVSSSEKEAYLWPLLLEKAYASYYRCYENLRVGNLVDMTAELIGAPPSIIDFTEEGLSVEKAIDRVGRDLMSEACVVLGENEKGVYAIEFAVAEDCIT